MYNKKELRNKVGIYAIRNIVNNKIYVGSSCNIASRWTEHEHDLRTNTHRNIRLQNAYNKYGKDKFVYEVIELLENVDKQFEREQYWIDTLGACNKKKGYNIQKEVLIVSKETKKVVCLETKEIFDSLEEAGRAKNISSGSISCCCNKRKLKQTGGFHWRFYDEYISMTEEDIKEAIDDNMWRKIVCLETKELFKSYHETGYNKCTVQTCCSRLAKGEHGICHGKHYMYENDYKKLSQEEVERIINFKPEGFKGSGEVICLETKEVYKNARKAALENNIADTGIINCCYKKKITCGGLHWMFKRDYDKLTEEEIQRKINAKGTDVCSKPVVCLETKKIFRSGKEAAKAYGMNSGSVYSACKRKGINMSKKNPMHFVFLEDYKYLSEEDIQNKINVKPKQVRKVRCIETGEIFNSVTEAAKYVKGDTTNISKCCKNQKYICKGYHWEYIT